MRRVLSDVTQENQKETHNDWTERMSREMHRRHKGHHYGIAASGSRKRKAPPPSLSENSSRPSKQRFAGINTKEEIHRAKLAQSTKKARATYEARFQAALKETSEKKLSYGDIPWPSKGSVDHNMEVGFSFLFIDTFFTRVLYFYFV
jgi:hypothetical protein